MEKPTIAEILELYRQTSRQRNWRYRMNQIAYILRNPPSPSIAIASYTPATRIAVATLFESGDVMSHRVLEIIARDYPTFGFEEANRFIIRLRAAIASRAPTAAIKNQYVITGAEAANFDEIERILTEEREIFARGGDPAEIDQSNPAPPPAVVGVDIPFRLILLVQNASPRRPSFEIYTVARSRGLNALDLVVADSIRGDPSLDDYDPAVRAEIAEIIEEGNGLSISLMNVFQNLGLNSGYLELWAFVNAIIESTRGVFPSNYEILENGFVRLGGRRENFRMAIDMVMSDNAQREMARGTNVQPGFQAPSSRQASPGLSPIRGPSPGLDDSTYARMLNNGTSPSLLTRFIRPPSGEMMSPQRVSPRLSGRRSVSPGMSPQQHSPRMSPRQASPPIPTTGSPQDILIAIVGKRVNGGSRENYLRDMDAFKASTKMDDGEINSLIRLIWENFDLASTTQLRIEDLFYESPDLDIKTAESRSVTLQSRKIGAWRAALRTGLANPGFWQAARSNPERAKQALVRFWEIAIMHRDEFNREIETALGSVKDLNLLYPTLTGVSPPQIVFSEPVYVRDDLSQKELSKLPRVVNIFNDFFNVPLNPHARVSDNPQMQDLLNNFGHHLDTLRREERAEYPDDYRLHSAYTRLSNNVTDFLRRIDISLVDAARRLFSWRNEYIDIMAQKQGLGRRCRNASDPLSFDGVNEIPEDDFIHLSNGNCWDIQSLIDVIVDKQGVNSAENYPSYGSPRLWETDADYRKIVSHPLARAYNNGRGLAKYIETQENARRYAVISAQTIQMMEKTAELFKSKGEAFDAKIREPGILTPAQLKAFLGNAKGNAYGLNAIPSRELADDIWNVIFLIIKQDALRDFLNYYDGLRAAEKAAIRTFAPDFDDRIRTCREGRYCLYMMAEYLVGVRNAIGDVTGLPRFALQHQGLSPPSRPLGGPSE